MVDIKRYQLPPTRLIPNSPLPLLHYPGYLSHYTAAEVYDLLAGNGWQSQWIYRYGQTQTSHYHSKVHECMAVLSGTATIRFGVADIEVGGSEQACDHEDGGIEIQARAGDVFVLPAGTAHKTFDTRPSGEFRLLTPGDGHGIAAQDVRHTLANVSLSGFTMIGAYPEKGGAWDFAKGGENVGHYEKVWSIPKPEKDPVLGKAEKGLCGQWS